MAKSVLLGRIRQLLVLLPAFLVVGSMILAVPPRRAEAALSSPLASYSFDRASSSNTQLFDESGNGNDCVVNIASNVYLDPGHTNQSIRTDSSNRYADCSNQNLKPTSALTVMAWFRVDTGGFEAAPIVMPQSGSTLSWGLYTGMSWTEGYGAYLDTTTGAAVSLPSNIAVDNTWHHLALTYDGANARFYLDGTQVASAAITGNIDYGGSTYPMKLLDNGITDAVPGAMDDLRVFGTALSQSEVQQMMNTPVDNNSQHVYDRSVTMSTAKPSATPATYSVSFKASESYKLNTFILDFCSNSPLVGQDCTAPGGFSVGGTPAISNFNINGSAAGGTWTGTSQNSGRTLTVAGSTGVHVAPRDIIPFDITTVTNPSSVTSFFGRMLTYNFASPTYSATDTDNYKESGGVALATANGIGFVFQVPETLEFCVYKVTCGDAPDVVLGHGPHMVIDDSQVDTDTAKASIATNALNGATIVGFGDTPHLTPTIRLDPTTPNGSSVLIVPGTEAFGIRIGPSAGAISANFCYRDSNAAGKYCFSNQMATTGTPLTRQATPGPFDTTEFTFTFAATASKTTQAGTYSSIISLVAVGEY
jgi:hypothetical protein